MFTKASYYQKKKSTWRGSCISFIRKTFASSADLKKLILTAKEEKSNQLHIKQLVTHKGVEIGGKYLN